MLPGIDEEWLRKRGGPRNERNENGRIKHHRSRTSLGAPVAFEFFKDPEILSEIRSYPVAYEEITDFAAWSPPSTNKSIPLI